MRIAGQVHGGIALHDFIVIVSVPDDIAAPFGLVGDGRCRDGVTLADVEIWDGKTLRGTRKGDHRAEQVLVRIQRALGKILSSHAIPAKTNEPTVALDLVRRLLTKGKLMVADAM